MLAVPGYHSLALSLSLLTTVILDLVMKFSQKTTHETPLGEAFQFFYDYEPPLFLRISKQELHSHSLKKYI